MERFSSGRILLVPLAFLLFLPLVSAHQPRLVMGWDIHEESTSLLVENPQVSQAFYGELTGKPDYYKIILDKPSRIYFAITVPYAPESRTDLTVELYDHKDTAITQVFLLDGTKFQWKPLYEPFGGDWYLQGPESRENLTNVTYYIKVSSPSNQGKYSLAIGEEESFPPGETLNAYLLLPIIKQQFFGKPILWIFLYLLGIVLAFGSFMSACIILLTSGKLRMKSAVNFFRKLSYPAAFGFLLVAAGIFVSLIQSPFNLLGMLRAGIFLVLVLLFVHAASRVNRIEDRIPLTLKMSMYLSVFLWLVFLFLTASLI
jgi:hypothetical protein